MSRLTRGSARDRSRPVEASGTRGYRSGRRRAVLVLMLLAMAAALGVRTFELQFRDDERILAWARDHRLQESSVMGVRGDILDRSGEPLATSVEWSAVYADPSVVGDPLAAASALVPLLGGEAAPLAQKMSVPGRFVYLQRQVPPEQAAAVRELELAGVATAPELHRTYPLGDFAVEIVGSVSTDHRGISGIELLYDEVLAARNGSELREMYPGGRSVPGGVSESVRAIDGADLRLTIDGVLQFEAARILTEQVSETDAAGGVIIVARPATGEILAMSTATRDGSGEVITGVENKAITWAFEPGSAIKGLTFSAVLDAGLATPATTSAVPDRLVLYDSEFTDYTPHPVLDYSVRDIVVESSNIGTILWGERLGAAELENYLRRFGLGARSGLGLYGESAGLLPALANWSGTSLATISIGQGVSLTPLQLLQAFNTIANDGVYVPARIVADFTAADGAVTSPPPAIEPRRVISSAAATHMQRILSEAVAGGTGQRAAVEGYAVAGKTGTARKPHPDGGYEDSDGNYRYVATFVGFLPASAPELSLIVVIDEPTATIFGGSAAGPAFAELAEIALRRLKVPPPTPGAPQPLQVATGGSEPSG
ncbi:MAG: penicillin-binding protein 2 [Acidimicrobiia bacterium]|nr:penicillin-binding protein 2 [Acidimicrobiia bacterium]